MDKGVKGPVVATVSKSLGQNVVVTTTSPFSAEYLLEKQSIWEHIIKFQSSQKDKPWHKVVLHGIPTADFNTPGGMGLIVEEITTFNKDLVPIGTPYWLTPSEKRLNQRASGGRELPSGHIGKSKISKSFLTFSLFIFCDIRTTAMAPPIINIEFMKDQIQQWYLTDCETIDTIIDRVFIEINTTISTRTMKLKLQTWGFQRRNNIVCLFVYSF